MSKNLIVIAAATLTLVSTAHAQQRGAARPGEVRAGEAGRAEVAREADRAGRAARAEGGVEVNNIMTTLTGARLTVSLSAPMKADLRLAMEQNPEVMKAVKEIAERADNQDLRDLDKARLEGMARTKGIKSDATGNALAALSEDAAAELAYMTLSTGAGAKAKTWAPELRDNLTFLLKRANEYRDQGMTPAEAMKRANADLAREKGVTVDLRKVREYCKV